MHRRNFRITAALLLLAASLLLSTTLDHNDFEQAPQAAVQSALDTPTLVVQLGRGRLVLSATTASTEHESGFRQMVADQFAGYETQLNFSPGVILANDWDAISSRLLYLLAATHSASAVLQQNTIVIRAVTSDAAIFATRLKFLRGATNAELQIDDDIIIVDRAFSFDKQCQRSFAELSTGSVAFRQSSTEIRTSSYALLDQLIEFAYDCRSSMIAITGHSDASGNESWNLRLSRERAQVVADYLARGGIAADRLQVDGRGSAMPVADNTTALGRSLNRRIELELR